MLPSSPRLGDVSGQRRRLPAPTLKERKLGGWTPQRKTVRVKPLGRREYVAFYARLAGLLFLTAIIDLILVSVFPLLCFHRKKWRLLVDHFQALWVNGLLWILPQQYLELSGDLPDASGRPKVVICNHQTDVDWIFLWMIARSCNMGLNDRSGSVKIMLKQEVQYVPFVGLGCTLFDFIFLKRSWKVDERRIEDKLITLCRDDQPLWIFLFPEGTTVNETHVVKGKAFSREKGRPSFDLLVLPRVKGLYHVLNTLNKHSRYPPEIFDMTMSFESYSGEIPTWEMGFGRNVDVLVPNFSKLMMGTSSKITCINSRRFCYKQLAHEWESALERLSPGGSVADKERDEFFEGCLEKWVDQCWERKEGLMRHFADYQRFPEEECGASVAIPVTGSIWTSLAAVCFYISMWAGMIFTYYKYHADGEAFFKHVADRMNM